MSNQLPALRHQRTQNLDQLVGRNMFDRHDLGDQLVGRAIAVAAQGRRAILLSHGLGHDLDHAALGDRRVAMHTQHRKEHIVDLVGLHRLGRDHGDLALHVWTEDEVFAGDLRNRRNQRLDIGILEVQRMPSIGIGGDR